jgi:hypothetical protein
MVLVALRKFKNYPAVYNGMIASQERPLGSRMNQSIALSKIDFHFIGVPNKGMEERYVVMWAAVDLPTSTPTERNHHLKGSLVRTEIIIATILLLQVFMLLVRLLIDLHRFVLLGELSSLLSPVLGTISISFS